MAKSRKNQNKPKLNLAVREEQRNKLEQMASLENRSISNLIEVMTDERWVELPEGSSRRQVVRGPKLEPALLSLSAIIPSTSFEFKLTMNRRV
jgi:uncharacterized protein (DUF1778 family)